VPAARAYRLRERVDQRAASAVDKRVAGLAAESGYFKGDPPVEGGLRVDSATPKPWNSSGFTTKSASIDVRAAFISVL
jgi:hypothetical protein